jgi:excisionase family DNA binding protein
VNVKQAAARLECSVATVYALVAARRIRFSRVGLGRGKIVISEEAVVEYLKAGEIGPSVAQAASLPERVKLKHLHL